MRTFSLSACDISQKGIVRSCDGVLAIVYADGATNMTVQGALTPGASWSAAVVKVLRGSSPGGPFVDFSSATSLTGAGITAEVDISATPYVALQTTTPEGSAQLVDFMVYMNERNA